jgi:hypothetical protein
MINAKLQNLYNIKNDIGTAIVNKGGTINESTPFYNYAGQIDNISTGTPQTIFQASDGSKWALSNVFNLVNNAGNVTYNYNYWQPANNTTSDVILNTVSVSVNIATNVSIRSISSVNAQILNSKQFIAQAINGTKYVHYNGINFVNNTLPSTTTFNVWLVNNSASGSLLVNNVVSTTFLGNITGNVTGTNESVFALARTGANYHSPSPSQDIMYLNVSNNGLVFVALPQRSIWSIYNFTTGAFIDNRTYTQPTVNYEGNVDFALSNDSVYVAVGANVRRFSQSNNTIIADNGSGSGYFAAYLNNGFVYALSSFNYVSKFREDNLQKLGDVYIDSRPFRATFHNGSMYVSGGQRSYRIIESNLTLNAQGSSPGGRGILIRPYFGTNYVTVSLSNNSFADFSESMVSQGVSAMGNNFSHFKIFGNHFYGRPFSSGGSGVLYKWNFGVTSIWTITNGLERGHGFGFFNNQVAVSMWNNVYYYNINGELRENLSTFRIDLVKE